MGQGAKDIGGEVKLKQIEKAKELYKRGYIVLPNPDDAVSERHSRKASSRSSSAIHASAWSIMMHSSRLLTTTAHAAQSRIAQDRAYRITDLHAHSVTAPMRRSISSRSTVQARTGMSPWRMMNEWGIPTIYLQSIAYKFAAQLAAKGKYVPPLAMAGGFSLEDHIFKALALGAPYFKAVCMGRS